MMANNPVPLLVPCHRVLHNYGRTGSYAFGTGQKVRLLEREGILPDKLAQAPYVATPITGIVSHASCHDARSIQPKNRQSSRSMRAVIDAGYQPCKVCRPEVWWRELVWEARCAHRAFSSGERGS